MKDDKRLKRKVRNSYIVSTVSITLVLFLLGSVGYLMVAALKVADTLQESIAVSVELKNGLSDEQREAIEKRLTDEEMVATIAYSPKEEKIDDQEFRKMFNSSFEEILQENPLLDSFELTLTSASADKELLDSFIAAVGRIDGVDRVSYPAQMAERLHATVNKIRLVLLMFGGALLDSVAAFPIGLLLQIYLFAAQKRHSAFMPYIWGSVLVTLLSGLLAACFPALNASWVVIGGIVPMVPGVTFTTSIREFFNGDYLSGVIHCISAVLTAVCIALGVCGGAMLLGFMGGIAL